MAATVWFITHPDVAIDPAVPVPDWRLSPRGIERMHAVLALPWVAGLRSVWSSEERKAREGAAILADASRLMVRTLAALGENDRSATGYLPRAEFETVADAFFANPEQSVRGWERAVDAQRRIVAAAEAVLVGSPPGDVAIVSHGGVGALLLCRLAGVPISRGFDQPPTNGGNWFAFGRESGLVQRAWTSIDGGGQVA
jgi:broad specificity phosphatase PhoE